MAIYKGLIISPGSALGPALSLQEDDFKASMARPFSSVEEELTQLQKAFEQTLKIHRERLKALQAIDDPHVDIWEAHGLMLEDPLTERSIAQLIEKDHCIAATAVVSFFKPLIQKMASKKDDYLKDRSEDLQVVQRYLLRALSGHPILGPMLPEDEPVILILPQLTSSETSFLNPKKVLGIVSETGSRTSHGAIMARTLGIPAMLGVRDATQKIKTGSSVFLDEEKKLVLSPVPEDQLQACRQIIAAGKERQKRQSLLKEMKASTADGCRIKLYGNLAHTQEIEQASHQGLDGVGLMRSEFLFMNRDQAPDEEEQFQCYVATLKAFAHQPVVIRTIDIGGDKPIPYLHLPFESNPFLGQRGIRFSLAHPELFQTQLCALLRASMYGDLRWMFPMVNGLEEVEQIRRAIEQAQLTLHQRGVPFKEKIPFGVMIETPSAVMIAPWLAEVVDFFSIGTNDLTQYISAADRLNEELSSFCNPLHPSLLRALHQVIQAAHQAGIEVALCGEMGSDPQIVPILIGMGLRELSMSPLMVPAIKELVMKLQSHEAECLTQEVLKMKTVTAVESLIRTDR